MEKLRSAGARLGGQDRTQEMGSADGALYFRVLPKVPVILMFWDAEPKDGFEVEAKVSNSVFFEAFGQVLS